MKLTGPILENGNQTLLRNKENLKPIPQSWPEDMKRMFGKQPRINKIIVFWSVMQCCIA
jgi:hypothetical protein